MAAGLAARLRGLADLTLVPGGFGEFTVLVDAEKIVDTNRFWYPNTDKVLQLVQDRLAR